MSKKEEIKRLWSESFNDSKEYVEMFFNRVYRDEDGLFLEHDGKVVSSLLLQQYDFLFWGSVLKMGYISGAATRRQYRGRGFMAKLLKEALIASYNRGDVFCSLIPAHEWLYYYYSKFGFKTVFYDSFARYTASHRFAESNRWRVCEDIYDDRVYDAFAALQIRCRATVLHTKRDYLNTLDDLSFDGGYFVAVTDGAVSAEPVGFAWAVKDDTGLVTVKYLLGESEDVLMGVLQKVKDHFGDFPMLVKSSPYIMDGLLCKRGMGRIVNGEQCLSRIAQSNPGLKCSVSVHDSIINENCGVYSIENGACVTVDKIKKGRADFEVDIPTLTAICFSGRYISDVLDFPGVRPSLPLMLD